MPLTIEDQFTVEAPPGRVWAYFSHPPRVVPCIPGAELTRVVDDNTYEGEVSLQVGPVRARFRGTVTIEAVDEEAHSMRMLAQGKQLGAVGRASARLQFGLYPQGSGTQVRVQAEVSIAGALARLGGGLIQNVTRQILRSFARCVQQEVMAATWE